MAYSIAMTVGAYRTSAAAAFLSLDEVCMHTFLSRKSLVTFLCPGLTLIPLQVFADAPSDLDARCPTAGTSADTLGGRL